MAFSVYGAPFILIKQDRRNTGAGFFFERKQRNGGPRKQVFIRLQRSKCLLSLIATLTHPSMKKLTSFLLFVSLLFLNGTLSGKQVYSCCHGEHPRESRIIKSTDIENDASVHYSIGDFIILQVDHPDSLLKTFDSGQKLYLWINGVCYANVPVRYIDRSCNRFFFQLDRDTSSSSPWTVLYTYGHYDEISKLAAVSIGTNKDRLTGCWPVALYTTEWWMVLIGILLIAGLCCLTGYLGMRLLRDTLPLAQVKDYKLLYKRPKNGEELGKNEIYFGDIPYSLSRAQLLFWNMIVIFAIIYVWMWTDELVAPTGTVLLIIGISGGTNFIGRIIDQNRAKKQAEQVEQAAPQAGAGAANAGDGKITVADFYANYKSRGFLTDIMSDGGGSISIHRFQLLIFTAIIGIYFVWQVIYGLSMPQFSSTVLVLMGISSSTYAGVKLTEN